MPVIINDFEVVPEPPRPSDPPPTPLVQSGAAGPPPSPETIVRILRREDQRQARVRAD